MVKFHSIEDFGGADSSHRLFTGWGWEHTDPDAADVIVFNGGTDIATSIYGEKPIPGWGIAEHPSFRDQHEIDMFNDFKGEKLLLGICRGAQLLNCLNGGTLWQDVNNHGRSHNMLDLRTGEILKVTSTHHQQMRPNLEKGELIGVASESTVKTAQGIVVRPSPTKDLSSFQQFLHPKGDMDFVDTEVVWYPTTRSLCIQGHPEYVPESHFARWSKALIESCF